MPTDSNGVHSLPSGYLATTGQTIQASQHNPPLEDVSAALTARLPRNGAAPMTGALKLPDGAVGAPTVQFTTATTTGFYKTSTGIGVAVGGVKVVEFGAAGVVYGAPPDASVSLAKMADLTHGRIIGRLSASDGVPQACIIPFGQCRLAKSGSNLVLSPYMGNLLTINSAAETIPDAGVSLTAFGLSNSTLYYVYAYMNSGTMTLEALETAYATQAGTGVAIKSGDATRTLVGMAYLTGGAFADGPTQRYTRSWFNDPGCQLTNSFNATRNQTQTTYGEINSEIRLEFLSWSGEVVLVQANGYFEHTTLGHQTSTSISFDGGAPEDTVSAAQTCVANYSFPFACSVHKSGLSEGRHYATLEGKTSGGTAQYAGSGTAGTRTTLRAFLKR